MKNCDYLPLLDSGLNDSLGSSARPSGPLRRTTDPNNRHRLRPIPQKSTPICRRRYLCNSSWWKQCWFEGATIADVPHDL